MEKKIIYLVAAALILRLIFISDWLEDWDSVQFVLGMDNFSLADHMPHPPGYIIYILLGKFLNLFLNNTYLSLALLSVFMGSFIAIPFYFLSKSITDTKYSLLSATILLTIPLVWLLSEVALTNIPGIFLTICTVYLMYLGKESEKHLLLGSLLTGLTLGVRFAEITILMSLLLLVLVSRKDIKLAIKALVLFTLGVSAWIVPTMIGTGAKEFFILFQEHSRYISSHDSIFAANSSISIRLKGLAISFFQGTGIFFVPITFLATKQLLRFNRSKFIDTFLLVWLLSYLFPLFIFYNLEIPRYTLDLIPPVILLATRYFYFNKSKSLKYLFYTISLFMFLQSLNLVHKFKNTTPPSIAPVIYVQDNFKPEDILLITSYTYRQFQYYAPGYDNYWGRENIPDVIDKKYVVIDYKNFAKEIPQLKTYTEIKEVSFTGEKILFPRLNETTLTILIHNAYEI